MNRPLKSFASIACFLLACSIAPKITPGSERTPAQPVVETNIEKLPDRVRATYDAILTAARSGELEALRPVLESNELMPQVSFGDAGDPIAYWKENSGDKKGLEILAILVNVLQMPYVRVRADTSNEMYIWPYLFEHDLDKLTPAQEVDLYRLMSPAEVETMRDFGGYIWYRLGIGRDGTWHFFLAGD